MSVKLFTNLVFKKTKCVLGMSHGVDRKVVSEDLRGGGEGRKKPKEQEFGEERISLFEL